MCGIPNVLPKGWQNRYLIKAIRRKAGSRERGEKKGMREGEREEGTQVVSRFPKSGASYTEGKTGICMEDSLQCSGTPMFRTHVCMSP